MGRSLTIMISVAMIGLVFGLGSIAMGIVSFLNSEWIRYIVNPQNVKGVLMENSRTRGILYECVTDIAATVLKLAPTIYGTCLYLKMNNENNASPKYWHIISLRRTHAGLHISGVGVVFIFIFCYTIAFIYWVVQRRTKHPRFLRRVQIVCGCGFLLAVLVYILSYVVYHILLGEEKVTMNEPMLPTIYGMWTAAQKANTKIEFAAMYYVGWGACGAALLAGVLLLISAGCCYPRFEKRGSSEDLVAKGTFPMQTEGPMLIEGVHQPQKPPQQAPREMNGTISGPVVVPQEASPNQQNSMALALPASNAPLAHSLPGSNLPLAHSLPGDPVLIPVYYHRQPGERPLTFRSEDTTTSFPDAFYAVPSANMGQPAGAYNVPEASYGTGKRGTTYSVY